MSKTSKQMPEQVVELLQLWDSVQSLFEEFYNFKAVTLPQIKANKLSPESLVDLGFLFREIEDKMDDWRKEAKATKELIGKMVCLHITQKSVENPMEASDCLHGELATGVAKVGQLPKIPRKGTAEFTALMNFVGVTNESVIESGLVKFDWSGLKNLVQQCAEEGRKLPHGLERTYPEFSTVFRRRS